MKMNKSILAVAVTAAAISAAPASAHSFFAPVQESIQSAYAG